MTHSQQNCPELNKSKQLEKGCSVVDSLLWHVKNDPIYASNPIILIFQSHQHTIHRDFSSCGPNRSFWSFFVAPKQRCKTVILWRLWRTMVQRCEGFSIRLLSPRSCCIIFIYTAFCIRLSKSLFVFCPNTKNSDVIFGGVSKYIKFFWREKTTCFVFFPQLGQFQSPFVNSSNQLSR